MITDAHVHIYEYINGYGKNGELRAIGNGLARWASGDVVRLIPEGMGDKAFTVERLIEMLDENHVDKALLLQGNLYGFQNEYILESIRHYPDRLSGACTVDPFSLNAPQILESLLEHEEFAATKFECSDSCGLMSFHPRFDLDGEVMEPLYQIVERKNATLVLDIGSKGMNSYQPDAVARIAKRHPELKIVVCHLLAHRKGERDELRRELEGLRLPNVWFDIAAVPWNTMPEDYPFPTALEYVRLAKETVGCEKLIWGSDAPGVIIHDSYEKILSYLDDVLTKEEKKMIFSKNATEVYNLL